ncbi:hypothetical protein BHM03_00052555 [Ensete ventricosum]|uniref:AP180 N-terminal homology (ANTH) domain-containing protein n=1 Tax=Ensete ventricosum TaxID=4639 RepID=A0A426Z185_ENSVE|nr:hypothetical protein B296_00044374 [Ensete ventricosum]RZR75241.1 hypothetical protein BHM03_00052555 [Ensete ventricosum]
MKRVTLDLYLFWGLAMVGCRDLGCHFDQPPPRRCSLLHPRPCSAPRQDSQLDGNPLAPLLFPCVALKTLIVIHRTLREGDPTFREELLNFSQRARILQLSNFKDDSSPIGIRLCLLTS